MEWTSNTHFQLFSAPCKNVGGYTDEMGGNVHQEETMMESGGTEDGHVEGVMGGMGVAYDNIQSALDVEESSSEGMEGAVGDKCEASSAGGVEGAMDPEEVSDGDIVNSRINLTAKIISFEPEVGYLHL